MKTTPKLTTAENELLESIYSQLPADAGYFFERALKKISNPSPSEKIFSRILEEMSPDYIQDLVEQLIENGDVDQDNLNVLHHNYPSIFTEDMLDALSFHFED